MAKTSETNKKIEELTNEIKELRKMVARGTRDNLNTRAAVAAAGGGVTETGEIILKDVQAHPGTARKEIVARTNITPLQVTKTVSELQAQDKLVKVGDRRTTRWFTPETLAKIAEAAKQR